MVRRATFIAAIGGLTLGAALLAALALQGERGRPMAGAALEPATPPALPEATILPLTPTVPVTPSLHPEWYPTSEPYFLPAGVLARDAAFAPDGFDVAFTLNRAAEGESRDVHLAPAGSDGELTGETRPLAGLPDGVVALAVKSNAAAGLYAVGGADESFAAPGGFTSLWLVSADGAQVERLGLAAESFAEYWWHPDGTAVAYLGADGALVLHDIETSVETVLATGLIGPAGQASVLLSFAPDGARAALGTYDRADLSATLETVTVASGARILLADFDVTGMPLPLYAADGRLYAFVADGARPNAAALYEVDPELPGPPVVLADLSTVGDAPAWVDGAAASPSGEDLYYVQGGSLWRIAGDGSERTELVARGAEVVRAGPAIRTSALGATRLGYLASTYRGAGGTDEARQGASTWLAVRTIDVPSP